MVSMAYSLTTSNESYNESMLGLDLEHKSLPQENFIEHKTDARFKNDDAFFEEVRVCLKNFNGDLMRPNCLRLARSVTNQRLKGVVQIICDKVFNSSTLIVEHDPDNYVKFCIFWYRIGVVNKTNYFRDIMLSTILDKLTDRFDYENKFSRLVKNRKISEEKKQSWVQLRSKEHKKALHKTLGLSTTFICSLYGQILDEKAMYSIILHLLNFPQAEESMQFLYKMLLGVVYKYKISDKEWPRLVNYIFERAVSQPRTTNYCAKICKLFLIVEEHREILLRDFMWRKILKPDVCKIKHVFSSKCRDVFDNCISTQNQDEVIAKTEIQMNSSHLTEFDSYNHDEEKRFTTTIMFVGLLAIEEVIPASEIYYFVDKLLTVGDELSIKCLCELLNVTRSLLESRLVIEGNRLATLYSITERMTDIIEGNQLFMLTSNTKARLQDVLDIFKRKMWYNEVMEEESKQEVIEKDRMTDKIEGNQLFMLTSDTKT